MSLTILAAGSAPLATKRNQGFSLVELSIVLVIIGLLVGGVLVGQTLIRSAELRGQMEQIKNYQTAINTFRLRFDGLPGDIDNATRMFLASEWPDIEDGNGNEKINDAAGDYDDLTGEVMQFWMQLGAAKVVEGSYNNTPTVGEGFPETAMGRNGLIAIFDEDSIKDNVFYIGVADAPNPGTDDAITGVDSLSPEESMFLDEKFDDGHPLFGVVRARSNSGGPYNQDPDFFDTLAMSEHMPVYANVLLSLLVSQAHAEEVDKLPEACVIMDTLATPQASEEAAYYALTNTRPACQLSVKME